jgi:hypothetical protein
MIGLTLLLAACDRAGQTLPTPLPVAVLPTPLPPTATPLLPPSNLTTVVKEPDRATAIPTEPVAPAATPTNALEEPGITITAPEAGSDLVMGTDLVARGLAQGDAAHTMWLSLLALDGHLLAEAQGVMQEGVWQASFRVPLNVSGETLLSAIVRDGTGETVAQTELPVKVALDTEASDRYLALFRPQKGDPAMGGFNLFFDGRAQRPVKSTVTISVWSDGCRTQVARQSFVLRGSGYWQGFVVIPKSVSGPGCAIAHFGTPGEASWRSVQVPLIISGNEDESAGGVTIGNPPPESHVAGGRDLLLYGIALATSEEPVQVTMMLENGRILTESSVTADFWGYWELLVLLPTDVQGPAAITASTEGGFEARTLISIDPAPTPTP